MYSFADINHDSTTRIPSSTSRVAPHGKQGASYEELWGLAILKENVHPCTTLRFPHTQGSTHLRLYGYIYGYMASDIWLRTILIVRKESRHIRYYLRLTGKVLLYAPSHRQDNTYHGHCYTSRGALAGTT